ncbi:hypothetical protein E2562_033956 [Oryza meyeriana var. granulata]|uniref:Cyclin n=1 Tax=Oryza meyeriana var. granulata TaxID=110450 RepID=A0A6G1C1E5_9ORYZ|nr:hypothetical protein E2562_033956 [Oryza meyeriana var. granulata]
MASTELASEVYALPCGEDGTTAPSAPVVVSVLASLLERHIARNERDLAGRREAAADGEAVRRAIAFDSGTVLDMSLQTFLERFSRYAHVSPQVYVVAYAYLDRLRRGGAVCIVSTNAQRLLTTAILVASKFVEDRNYKNSYFAAVGGLSAAELSSLELDFLFLMQFRLNVSVSVFQSYCRHLEREVSYGGGYQVERCLKKALVCSGEAQAQQRQAAAAAAQ